MLTKTLLLASALRQIGIADSFLLLRNIRLRMSNEDQVVYVSYADSAVNKQTKIPQVSIGMPVYNGELFISQALDSLLAQTFTDFELIISDNASTDATEAICREYAAKDPRIRYVRQMENRGPVANFQFVLDEAVGEYFMWAAADDVWSKEWIEKLLLIAFEHQCLAYGRVVAIDANGKFIPNSATGKTFLYSGNKLLRRMRYFGAAMSNGKSNPIYGLCPKKLITPDAFSVLSDSNPGSDMLYLYKILKTSEILSESSVSLFKRIHSGCVGGGHDSFKPTKFNVYTFPSKILLKLAQVIKVNVNVTIDYIKLSSFLEIVFMLIVLPLKIFTEIYKDLIWYLFKNKIKIDKINKKYFIYNKYNTFN